MEIIKSKLTALRVIGRDEKWLQDWLVEDPTRLGLGNVSIKSKELQHYSGKGGRLDVLAYDAALDTYYEIEIMLGECDADHGFRTLDYWARERLRLPNARHVAVIIAEHLGGRYSAVIETLAQHLPLIAIELKTIQLDSTPPVATTFPVIIAQPDDAILRPADEPGSPSDDVAPNDEASWQASRPEFTELARQLYKICNEKIGPSTNDFRAKSYISLKKGRRAWLPIWPRVDGCYIYIPGGADGKADQPSEFFSRVKESIGELGIEPTWTFTYNAGANPIAFGLPKQYVNHSKILEILREAFEMA